MIIVPVQFHRIKPSYEESLDSATPMNKPTHDQLHADPSNWKCGIFYFCRRDQRIIVPKRIRGPGWTINFARPSALLWVAVMILFVYGTSGRSESRYLVDDQGHVGARHHRFLLSDGQFVREELTQVRKDHSRPPLLLTILAASDAVVCVKCHSSASQ